MKMINYLVITDNTKLKAYGEHDGKIYKMYFDNISPDLMYFQFDKRWQLEEYMYRNGFEKFIYKSSNGKEIVKIGEYIPSKIEEWKHWYGTKTKQFPEKYSYDDWNCGHFIKE